MHRLRDSCDALMNTHTHLHIRTRGIFIGKNVYFDLRFTLSVF